MRILIDGFWWNAGPYSNRMVSVETVKQWVRQFPQDEVILAIPKLRESESDHSTIPSGIEVVDTHLRKHPAINLLELPIIAKRKRVDATLTFSFSSSSKRSAVFLHDVLYQSNPEWFSWAERRYFSLIPVLARRPQSVITTSKNERERIIEHNPRLKRVINCGLAVFPPLARAAIERPNLNIAESSYIVCVGRFNVRKNLERTVRALQKTKLISPHFPVVLIGEASGVPADFSKFADALAEKSVIMASNLSNGELKWLYKNCRFFVCLSLDEGFGLPVVEAATFGAPVLVSDIPVFRETVGSYGTFTEPTDLDSIAAAALELNQSVGRSREPYTEQFGWESICLKIRDELLLIAQS